MKKYKIILNKRQIKEILYAISEVPEYSTSWDNLAGNIIKQSINKETLK